LIGRNGSGKSTFLKLITGIYKPDLGRISVHGRVSALIELGAGFHPDFTGRENLMLAGVMHGLSRDEVLRRFDEIVRFAELEHVIDDPVRTYSSGMFMRLGFSIAIHTDPDILLVDEVLAVGDAGFVAKCKDRIAELRKQGKTLVLVTHDLDAVERWCDEVVWLDSGEVKDRGYPRRVIDAYRQFIERGEEAEILKGEQSHTTGEAVTAPTRGETSQPARWGSREVEVTAIELCDRSGTPKRVFHPDDSMRIRVSYTIHSAQDEIVFGVGINRADGLVVFGTNTYIERVSLSNLTTVGAVECVLERVGLIDGAYALDVATHRTDGYPFDFHKDSLHFSVRSDKNQVGVLSPSHHWALNGKECACSA
jgi:ABC-type polysaccharide/polyol phosphate transport system ATPase subunit